MHIINITSIQSKETQNWTKCHQNQYLNNKIKNPKQSITQNSITLTYNSKIGAQQKLWEPKKHESLYQKNSTHHCYLRARRPSQPLTRLSLSLNPNQTHVEFTHTRRNIRSSSSSTRTGTHRYPRNHANSSKLDPNLGPGGLRELGEVELWAPQAVEKAID